MMKEAILNAERHSKGSKLFIKTFIENDEWNISIADNGVGINSENKRQDSYGLAGMFERAENIGAEISIISPLTEENIGTEILLSVPLHIIVASRLEESL